MRRSRDDMGLNRNGSPGFAHALRRHARGKFQFRKPRGAIIAAIKSHAIVQPRIEPQPAMRDVLEREQQLRVSLEQQILIRSPKGDHDVRLSTPGFAAPRCSDVALEVEAHFAHHQIEETV